MGSRANLDSTTTKRATKTNVNTKGTITAADFQGNISPPKFNANRNKMAATKMIKVPIQKKMISVGD